jgi:hypothetical protein
MEMRDHDAVNSKTLNRGRAGSDLDAAFGAGAAEPTKLEYRHGYGLDGGDYFTVSAAASFPSGTYSVVMFLDIAVVGGDYLFDATAGAGVGSCSLVGSVITPTSGTVYQDFDTSTTLRAGLRTIVIAGITLDASTSLIIGADNAGANNVTGELYTFGITSGTLAPSNVNQFFREQREGLHRI